MKSLLHALSHVEGLSRMEWINLLNHLESAEIAAFTELAQLIQDSHSIINARFRVDGQVGDFLSCISSTVSPVVSLIPFCIRDIIVRLSKGYSLIPSEQQRLHEISPVFHGFYRYLVDRRYNIKVWFQLSVRFEILSHADWYWKTVHHLFSHLITKLDQTYKTYAFAYPDAGAQRRRRLPQSPPPLREERHDFSKYAYLCDAENELFHTGHYYPGMPVIRQLRKYIRRKAEPACRKESRSGSRLGPGTFFVFCVDCRRCLGFHVMKDSEGPKTVCN